MPDGGASIWLPLLIGGATATATTAIGAYASGKAADTQAAYGQQALALENSIYNEAKTRSQPYITSGTNAENALSTLMGLGTGGPLGGSPNPGQPSAAAGLTPMPPGAQMNAAPPVIDTRTPLGQTDQQAWNPLTTLMSASAPAATGPFGAPTATAPPPGAGSMVMMKSPDGQQTKAVPRELVAHYQQQGATIVPGAGASM